MIPLTATLHYPTGCYKWREWPHSLPPHPATAGLSLVVPVRTHERNTSILHNHPATMEQPPTCLYYYLYEDIHWLRLHNNLLPTAKTPPPPSHYLSRLRKDSFGAAVKSKLQRDLKQPWLVLRPVVQIGLITPNAKHMKNRSVTLLQYNTRR